MSLAICVHSIWSFVRKQHLHEHTALYHNARWAIDLAVVALWLGVILIQILVPISQNDFDRQLGGTYNNSGSDAIVVVGAGANYTELFSAWVLQMRARMTLILVRIIFFMTTLLLAVAAFRARKTGGGIGGGKDGAGEITGEHGLQASHAAPDTEVGGGLAAT